MRIEIYSLLMGVLAVVVAVVAFYALATIHKKTGEQRLCEAYYSHTCTRSGELPEGVVIIK